MFKNFYIALVLLLFINLPVFSNDPIHLYNESKISFFKEDYYHAISLLKEAIEINPNYSDAILLLSKIYYELENYEYSYNYIKKLLELNNNIDINIFAAQLEIQLKMFELAESRLIKITKDDPLNIKAHNSLALLYLKTNNKILAEKKLLDVLKSDPHNFESINMLAQYYEDFNSQLSEKYYLLNIEKNSLNPESFFQYSLYHFKKGNIFKAIDLIKTAIKLKNHIKYNKFYGKYLLAINQADQALKIFKQIIKIEPENHIFHYNIAYAHYLTSNYNQSVLSLLRAINYREDDEISEYFLNSILINNFETDNHYRIKYSKMFFQKALKAKKDSQFDIYISHLKEAIKLYPKNIEARLELANYFLFLNLPERYLMELEVAAKYTDDVNLMDKIEIEKKRISYQLGDDWNINQYDIPQDLYKIPVFYDLNIENTHYNFEKSYINMLQNLTLEDYKFEIMEYSEKNYGVNEKLKLSKKNHSPFYVQLNIKETNNIIEIHCLLMNAINNETMKEYQIMKSGNNKIITSVIQLLKDINQDLTLVSHIVFISKDKAILNLGRRNGIKVKDQFLILKNKNYLIEPERQSLIYQSDDIKGHAIAIKVDENITEIMFKDDDFFPDIDIDDIVILK